MKIKITCRPRYNPWLKKYLNTKTFSKILAFGILINSVPINSFAGILSDDRRYETFEGSNITINDILEEDKVDVEIEGNTLVNLVQCNNVNVNVPNTRYFSKRIGDNSMIKANTVYTVIYWANKTSNHNPVIDGGVPFEIVFGGLHSDDNWGARYRPHIGEVSNYHVGTYTTPSDYYQNTEKEFILIGEYNRGSNYNISTVILEGDWTNKELPKSYFEGMKSVGQDNKNGHNVEVSAVKGKPNLLKNSGFLEGTRHFVLHNGAIGEIVNDDTALSKKALKITADKLNSGTYVFNPIGNIENKRYIVTGYCKGEAGKSIYVNMEGHKRTVIDFIDNNWVKFSVISELNPVNWNKNITFYNLSNEGQVFYLKDLKLEISETPTPYIPHYTESNYNSFVNRKEVLLTEPLRSLSNGVKDKIIKRNGQWVIERNCAQTELNEHSYISIHNDSSDKYIRFRVGLPSNAYNSSVSNVILDTHYKCDRMPYLDVISPGGSYISNSYGLYKGSAFIDGQPVCYISINKDKLSSSNIEGFRQWLSENPINIIYQLSEPVYELLNIEPSLNMYKHTTYISTNSIIPANLKVTVDRTINRATEAIELAKTNPTIENLSRARYWTNLLKESSKKDELQEEINNNVDIVDLQLERKTTSANLDLYIKCENMLSMSLDTNQIAFDDFSGIEDVEKINAVNISINSSLPYQLNAYLPSEIQNADKTKTLDKSILNIKENSESTYQAFANTIDKVVLKDNCSSGNQLVHGIDIRLKGGVAHEKDVYKAVIKLEAEQK